VSASCQKAEAFDVSKHYMNMTLREEHICRKHGSDQGERGNGALYCTRLFVWRTIQLRCDRRMRSRDEASISATIFSAKSVAVVRTQVYCNACNMSMQRRLTYC
jgi:hypothetical protein